MAARAASAAAEREPAVARDAAAGASGPPTFTAERLREAWDAYMLDGARYGDLEDVREALERGADVNASDVSGKTALHMAAANGHTAIVKLLLVHGAETERRNRAGNTALHWACVGGAVDAVALLLRHGANASALNDADRTPLDDGIADGAILALFEQHRRGPPADASADALGRDAPSDDMLLDE